MSKNLSKKDFIDKASSLPKHKNKYHYYPEIDDYVNVTTKIKIKCLLCNKDFEQRPADHMNGKGCFYCYGSKKLTKKLFVFNAKKHHGDKYYYYPEVEDYVNSGTKIKIKCLTCNEDFYQRPGRHLLGSGCPKCGGSKKLTKDDFVKKAMLRHNNKYDYYPKVEDYVNSGTKIKIKCLTCKSDFLQTPSDHLNGYGCPNCGGSKKLTKDLFIKKAMKIHCYEHKYFYYPEINDYFNNQTKINIKCLLCNKDFKQRPNDHLNGQGCPYCCKKSKGCMKIISFLKENHIEYDIEYTFDDCVSKRSLRFDFYLPKHNLCIEYDGKQHFKSIDFFGGQEAYLNRIKNDKIKDDYCKDKGLDLIRIPYFEIKNIDNILNNITKR
jgi:hypothetical protein